MQAPSPSPSGPRVVREIARNVGRAVLATETARQVIGGALLLALFVVFVPLGLVVLFLAGALFVLVFGALGVAFGNEANIILGVAAIAYWVGALVVLFLVFRRAYRWLSRRATAVSTAAEIGFGSANGQTDDGGSDTSSARQPAPAAATPSETALSLAELDARFAPPEPASPADR